MENKNEYINQLSNALELARQKGAFNLQQLSNVHLVMRYYKDGNKDVENLTDDKAFAVMVECLEAGSKVGAYTFQNGAILYATLLRLKEILEKKTEKKENDV
jgi:hypothetical protein